MCFLVFRGLTAHGSAPRTASELPHHKQAPKKSVTTDDAAHFQMQGGELPAHLPPAGETPTASELAQKAYIRNCPCEGHFLCLSCLLAHRPKRLARLSL